jgi:hypothetical protein
MCPPRTLRAALFAIVLSSAGAAHAREGVLRGSSRLSPEEVEEAIAWGQKASRKDLEQYVIKIAPTWTLNFDTPFLRIAQLAHAWKQKELELHPGDVSASMSADDVHIYALAIQQPGVTEVPENVNHVTMARPGGIELIQPKSVSTNLNRARRRDDYKGVAKISQSVTAVFSKSDLVAGNEIRILFEGGGRDSVKVTKEMVARR